MMIISCDRILMDFPFLSIFILIPLNIFHSIPFNKRQELASYSPYARMTFELCEGNVTLSPNHDLRFSRILLSWIEMAISP